MANPFENLTDGCKQLILATEEIASQLHQTVVGTEHLVLAIAKAGDAIRAGRLFQLADVSYADLKMRIDAYISSTDGGVVDKVPRPLPMSPRFKRLLVRAPLEASAEGSKEVQSYHLLLAMLADAEGLGTIILNQVGLTYAKIKQLSQEIADIDPNETFDIPSSGQAKPSPEAIVPPVFERLGKELDQERDSTPSNMSDELPTPPDEEGEDQDPMLQGKGKAPALDLFARDLTALASEGKLDPVIGRDHEIARIIQILSRRTKNNAMLLGEAGVGKTALAEGLAIAIAAGQVPERIAKKRVLALDMTLMVAGAKYRGQFEERIKTVIAEVKADGNVILFLDEIHTIVGAGGGEGAMDAANIIKPALARGEMQCIGATTLNEYRKSIEKDAALERRFQTVRVEEPTIEEAIKILQGLAPKYAAYHQATYTPDALEAAVRLAARYMPARQLPDKAIDLMDEAGASMRMGQEGAPREVMTLNAKIAQARHDKQLALSNKDFDQALIHREDEVKLRKLRDKKLTKWQKTHPTQEVEITAHDIAKTVATMTKIPIEQMTQGERERLLTLDKTLKQRIIGQDAAIEQIAKSLRRARAGLKDPNRPIGSYFCLGPTGVGKTLLAKALAAECFGSDKALIQLDMSEYMEKHTTSRLVGSPPGYVGHEEGGQLTERVRRQPYSVVLFDEIEKAHPDVTQMLLQILEEGRLTDSLGREIDFKNTIIILTSNLGCDFHNDSPAVGFNPVATGLAMAHDALTGRIMKEAKKNFKPELLNRFDQMIVFKALDQSAIQKIVDLEIEALRKRLSLQHISFRIAPKTKKALIEQAWKPEEGARAVRRAIESLLEDPLAEAYLQNPDQMPIKL